MEISNRVFVITGISKGIGKSLARQILARGGKVAGWGNTEPDYTDANLFFVKTNVRDRENVVQAFDATQKHFGGEVHGLINNAGLGYFGYFDEMPPEQFEEIFEVNVYGTYHTCRVVVPQMKKQQYGHVINISSIAGLEGQAQGAAYCGAKHAVRGITDSMFRELRDFGIKVTGVYPGSTNTNFFDNAPGIKAHPGMMDPEEVAAQIVRAIETSDNFLVNTLEFRPLQPKPKP
jgi:NAD(P)-dependent dehydrogenase (short-subunit alcohol dehydrogenase family)